jgi:deoxyribonuclease-4
MRIGLHTSIAKSLEGAALRASELCANTFQIFSASPRQWKASSPSAASIALLNRARDKHDLTPLVIHDNYLINLAAADEVVWAKSVEAFRGELERGIAIGAEFLVAHPGNYKGQTVEQGIFRFLQGIAQAAAGLKFGKLMLLAECTVGAGAQIGGRFEELAAIREFAPRMTDLPVGFCLDTCHLFGGSHVERGLSQEDSCGSRARPGCRSCSRDPRQRFQSAARFARRPASAHRARLYWIRRVSSHSHPPAASFQSFYS